MTRLRVVWDSIAITTGLIALLYILGMVAVAVSGGARGVLGP